MESELIDYHGWRFEKTTKKRRKKLKKTAEQRSAETDDEPANGMDIATTSMKHTAKNTRYSTSGKLSAKSKLAIVKLRLL